MPADRLSVHLERLRTLYTLLAAAGDSRNHDDLIDRTRVAIADVRRARAGAGTVTFADQQMTAKA